MPALLATALVAAAVSAAGPPAWIDDDWPRALAQAKERAVPLFVDAWAPW